MLYVGGQTRIAWYGEKQSQSSFVWDSVDSFDRRRVVHGKLKAYREVLS